MQFSTITLVTALASTSLAAPAALEPRVDCSSDSCQTLQTQATCLLSNIGDFFGIIGCLADGGGVSNLCPCIACVPEVGDVLSQPGIC